MSLFQGNLLILRKWKARNTSRKKHLHWRDYQFLLLFPRCCQMENSCFTSRDSQPNWILDIPKEQTGRLSRTIELWASQNKYMYCGREHEEGEGCFFGFSYFHNLLYHIWMSVRNTSSGEHSCTVLRLMHSVGTNKQQQRTEVCWGLRIFLTVTMCAQRKKVVWNWRQTRSSRKPPHTSSSTALCSWGGHFSTRPRFIHRLMTATPTPEENLSFALQLGFLAKTYRIPDLYICLWQLQLQFLFWGLQWA